MHNAHPECSKILGVTKTNAFAVPCRGSQKYVTCLKASRFNHSCAPNVLVVYSDPYERIFAVRNIKKGEELCITYIDWSKNSYGQGKARLKLKCGFECMCEICDRQNEKKRLEFAIFWETYNRLDKQIGVSDLFISPSENLEAVDEILNAMEEFGWMWHSLIARNAYDGFQLALVCRHRRKANRFIKQAYEANMIAEGEYSPMTKKFLNLMKNPQQHILFRGWN